MPGAVLPPVIPLTDVDARELLAPALLKLCSESGPTAIGRAIDCNEKTVRDARDEKALLSLHTAANVLALDGTAFDPFLRRIGRRSVPVDSKCDTDVLPAMTGAVHRLVVATSPGSPGGHELHRSELLAAESELQGAFDAIGALLGRIERLKKGEAA